MTPRAARYVRRCRLVAKLQAGPKAKAEEKPARKSREEWEAEREAEREADRRNAGRGQQGGGAGVIIKGDSVIKHSLCTVTPIWEVHA